MAIIQCPHGHFYDDTKFTSCPHCRNMEISGATGDALREDRTVSMRKVVSAPVPQPQLSADDLDKTVSIFSVGQAKSSPGLPVGWLICVDGPEKGREHRILAGRNFAGRGLGMDICLSADPEIDMNDQFSIVYDPQSLGFSVVPGKGGLTQRNGETLSGAEELHDYDTIRAGKTTLMLRSFCGEAFQW